MLLSWHMSWILDEKGTLGGFQFHKTFTIKSIEDIKAGGKKMIKGREKVRKGGGKNESWSAHGPILCTLFTAKQYLRLCLQPWQGDGQ